MTYRIRCYTLFDITKTNIPTRKKPLNLSEDEIKLWELRRNTQCNYDTILQVVSLRSQPENMSNTTKIEINFKEFQNFGFLFEEEENQHCWYFEFDISHKNVFHDGITELGNLDYDCHEVPIIKVGTEWDKLPAFIDTSPELRNTYFEIINNEE
jgi:hypothetical protein